jgi:hypothetical protein
VQSNGTCNALLLSYLRLDNFSREVRAKKKKNFRARNPCISSFGNYIVARNAIRLAARFLKGRWQNKWPEGDSRPSPDSN